MNRSEVSLVLDKITMETTVVIICTVPEKMEEKNEQKRGTEW